jgi:hypothetical protein
MAAEPLDVDLDIDDALANELAAEMQLIREAALLVAHGAATRVVVANVRHGRLLLLAAEAMAAGLGLHLEGLATSAPARTDVAVECLRPIAKAQAREIVSTRPTRAVRAANA